MRECHRKLPRWNDTPHELALWDLDQVINARGIGVDVEFATAAVRATKAEQKRLGDRCQELTDDNVMRATQRNQVASERAHRVRERGAKRVRRLRKPRACVQRTSAHRH